MRSNSDMTHAQRAALGATAGDHERAGQSLATTGEDASDRRPAIRDVRDMLALLAWAAGYDRIERGRYEAEAWLELLHGLPVADVKDAITEHFRSSRYPVMPADIIRIIEEGPAQ